MSMGDVYLSFNPEQAPRVRTIRAALESADFTVREHDVDAIDDAVFFIACAANDELQRALERVRSGARDRSWLVVLPLDGAESPAGAQDGTRVSGLGGMMSHVTSRGPVHGDAQVRNVHGPKAEIHGVIGDGEAMRGENVHGSVGAGDIVVDRTVVITGVTMTSRKRRP
ncbi:MAG TPA: hypothetical protein VEO54_26320 [Thermoanaerobaculia bacterium]|nr:hypothetical protein [Thermoanaerobaculia bacterium]